MKNVIITGADGFVGSYTTNYFTTQGIKVLALDIFEKPHRLKEHENLSYLKGDFTDHKFLLEKIPAGIYDTFIHFAWLGSSGSDRSDYKLQLKNAYDAVEILKIAKRLGCTRFISAGSIMEYEVEAVIHAQGSCPGMAYIYGMGKHIAHCMCKAVAADIGIDLIWPIITNTYGVGELSPRMLNTTITKIINGEPLKFTSALQNYDFIYVADVARAYYLIAQKGKPFCEYVVGSGNAKPLKNFLLELQRVLAPAQEISFGDIPFTGINLPLNIFCTDSIEKDCDFKPQVSFEEGIKLTMNWQKQLGGKIFEY